MSRYHLFMFCAILCVVMSVLGCKQDKEVDSSIEAWGADTLSHDAPARVSAGDPSNPSAPKSDRTPTGENLGKDNGVSNSSGTPGSSAIGEGAASGVKIKPATGRRWWDNRKVFFIDWVGGTGDIVYEAVEGQRYFPETIIFIYATDKAMEGTVEHSKTEMTMKETEINDRIFIWVHLDNDRKPVFVKTLISNNIKDKIDTAPLIL